VSTVPNDADDIRRQMAQVRRELHKDVRGVVATAEAVTDWRRYLTIYPFVTLGAAFAVGYFIVPRKRKPAEAIASSAGLDLSIVQRMIDSAKVGVSNVKAEATPAKRKKGLIGAGLAMVAPMALRAAQGYAMKYLESWLVQQQDAHFQKATASPFGGATPGPAPRAGFGPNPGAGGPGGPRRPPTPGGF